MGEAFALASAVCWAVAVILYRRSGESFGPFTLNFIKNLLAAVLLVPTLAVFSTLQPPPLTAEEWLICIVSGLIGLAVADSLYFAALNRLGAGRTGIVAALFSPAVIVLSILFLDERLVAAQVAGLALVLGGITLVSRGPDLDIAPGDLHRGLAFGLASVVLMAVGIVMVKRILEQHDVLWIAQIRLLAGIAGMAVVLVLSGRLGRFRAQLAQPHRWGILLAATFVGTYLAIIFLLAGYKYTLASVAAVLNETAAIFIVLFAWLFLGETLTRRKLAAVALAFGGVALMLRP